MQLPDFSRLRILIVGARGHAATILRTVLSASGITRVSVSEDANRALELLCIENFDAVFIEEQVNLDGTPFAMAARRSVALKNPLVPIFAVHSDARRRDVEHSRDLGVNDVIARPFSVKTIRDKLRLALSAPRPFIAAPHFFGPDRRSQARAALPARGRDRRVRTPQKIRLPISEI